MADQATSADYRISDVQRVTLNGRAAVLFTAHRRQGAAYIHVGRFSAPARTPKRDLWRIADASATD